MHIVRYENIKIEPLEISTGCFKVVIDSLFCLFYFTLDAYTSDDL